MRRAVPLILLILVAWYGFAFVTRVAPTGPLLVIAHRGAPTSSDRPENTLAAFREAIEDGATALELDVRRTADGELVVLHDATVDRTTDGTGPVAQLALSEVQALDAGRGERIPTVAEVIELAGETQTPIWAEIKDPATQTGIAGDLVTLLRERDYLGRTRILSFDAHTLTTLAEDAPDARMCWLTGPGTFDVSSPPAGVDAVCPSGEMLLLHPGMIGAAHHAGLSVFAWWSLLETGVTNDVLIAYGVDGLILDDVRGLP
jgi:glycerophosphoryl diester phosphodiesterase